jgi:hypothetical protein
VAATSRQRHNKIRLTQIGIDDNSESMRCNLVIAVYRLYASRMCSSAKNVYQTYVKNVNIEYIWTILEYMAPKLLYERVNERED